MMNHRHHSTRRDFCAFVRQLGASSVLAGAPLDLLVRSVLVGAAARAAGQGGPSSATRKFVRIALDGAPPLNSSFLLLNPYEPDSNLVTNPHFGTAYTANGGVYTGVTYGTVPLLGVNVPPLWQSAVPKAAGGTRPMADLLTNFLQIRGIDTDNPAHPGSQANSYLPIGIRESLPALAADASQAAISGINMSAQNYQFRSRSGLSPVYLPDGGNMLQTLLSPFQSQASSAFKSGLAGLQAATGAASAALARTALSLNKEAAAADAARVSAEALMARPSADLTGTWAALVAKYEDLVVRAIDPTVAIGGVTDKAIGSAGGRGTDYQMNGVVVNDPDLRATVTTLTSVAMMAQYFAVTEFVLLNGYSDSVVFAPRTFTKLVVNGALRSGYFDEHETGRMVSLYTNALYSRALAACLLELIDRLRAAPGDLFASTVIEVNPEFTRSPRADGSGSDHGYKGATANFLSGLVGGPMVLGNVAKNSPDTAHPGTWGYGAPSAPLAGGAPQSLSLAHVAATVATLLGVPSPTTAVTSLVSVDGGRVVPLLEPARLV